ncbi:MAG: FAD:protein FMN transferase [Lachnospiraceae bacterium]|nr:FAD:protein FMN transferase [Lachnospiraceae bacterium]
MFSCFLPKLQKFTGSILCFFLSIAVLLLFPNLTGCGQNMAKETRTGFYLNTVISITLYGTGREELFEGCMEMADSYEHMLSRTIEGSDVWNINHSGGMPVTVHDETRDLLNIALSYAEMSEGLVDPTIGTLSSLWNFGEDDQGTVPSEDAIIEALSHVNYRNIMIEGNQVTLKDPQAMIDLGFVAKGYIADRMKEYLIANNVKSAVINLGGNVLTIGGRPDHTPFKVGIQKPFADAGTSILILDVQDRSLVSSGNYERFFLKEDVLYHHILSTSDGYPADSGLSGVTIISERSVDGDALSTYCFILGYEKGKKLIDSLQGVEAVFISEDGTVL